jgi:hypothetical protein
MEFMMSILRVPSRRACGGAVKFCPPDRENSSLIGVAPVRQAGVSLVSRPG